MFHRLAVAFPLALAMLLPLGCGGGEGAAVRAATFVYSTNGTPTSLDPVQSATRYSNLIVTAVYDTLYEYKYLQRPYELKPNLAADMPEISEDGLTYTIRLKQGVEFIDDECFPEGVGREVTAHDVEYSIKRMFDPETRPQGEWIWQGRIKGLDQWKDNGSNYEESISGIRVIDDHTIEFELTQPYPQFVYTLAMGYSGIVPREAVEYYGREFGIKPIGSGPYMLEQLNRQRAILVANPKFREDILDIEFEGYDEEKHGFTGIADLDGMRMPLTERVEVKFMTEPTARWLALNSGEVDNATMPNEQASRVTNSVDPLEPKAQYQEKFNYLLETEMGFVFTNFNMADPRIGYNEDPERERRNKLLRKAIRKAFDWEDRIDAYYLGVGEPFPGVILPQLDAYDPNVSYESVTTSVEEAKTYLRQGGWNAENLPVLEYHTVASSRGNQFFEQFRGWMVKIGYPSEKISLITHASFGDYNKVVREGEAMLIGMGWGLDYPDSENVLQLYYGPNKAPGSNSANFENEEYDRLFREAKTMLPSPERTEIYRRLNEIIIEEAPTISGYSRSTPIFWSKDVVMYPSPNVIGNIFKYVKVNRGHAEGASGVAASR